MEENSYNPIYQGNLEESDRAYEPDFLPSELADDSFFDELSEEEDYSGPVESNPYETVNTARVTPPNQDHQTASEIPVVIPPQPQLAEDSDDDLEYRVEPILDVTTPAYAPSQTFNSPSEVSTDSSDINSPTSPGANEMKPTRAKLDKQLAYSPSSSVDGDSDLPISPVVNRSSIINSDIAFTPSSPTNNQKDPDAVVLDDNDNSNLDINRVEQKHSSPIHVREEDDEDDDGRQNDEFEGFERDDQPKSQLDGIIADIFGESDAEEDFEGFAENELETGGTTDIKAQLPSEERIAEASAKGTGAETQNERQHDYNDDEDDDDDGELGEGDEFVSDFDRIMERKREEMRRRKRRNRDIEFLNDSDDLIVAVINRMRRAADDDRQLLAENKPATKKLTMISEVTKLLRRADLKVAVVENGMLSAITEWLSPLPGHTLPNLIIRDSMLTSLAEFNSLSTEVLQESGIGKALMYLYKHPRETRENKARASRLINDWLRPIFNLASDYRTLTKEERKQLDYEHLPKRRNIDNENYDHRDINRELDGEAKGLLRPGDPGWVGRARVPQPSNKDYVIRPHWRVSATGEDQEVRPASFGDGDEDEADEVDNRQVVVERRHKKRLGPGGAGVGPTSRIENHIRQLTNASRQRNAKSSRAVSMSIGGRNM